MKKEVENLGEDYVYLTHFELDCKREAILSKLS